MEVDLNSQNVIFRYSSPLKTLYKEGKIPSVKYGFYGDRLSPSTVSLEHLQAKSKGGKSCLSNYVLASKRNNWLRGNDDIREHFDSKSAARYLDQFLKVDLKRLHGLKYIGMILNTLSKLGIDVSFYNLESKLLDVNG